MSTEKPVYSPKIDPEFRKSFEYVMTVNLRQLAEDSFSKQYNKAKDLLGSLLDIDSTFIEGTYGMGFHFDENSPGTIFKEANWNLANADFAEKTLKKRKEKLDQIVEAIKTLETKAQGLPNSSAADSTYSKISEKRKAFEKIAQEMLVAEEKYYTAEKKLSTMPQPKLNNKNNTLQSILGIFLTDELKKTLQSFLNNSAIPNEKKAGMKYLINEWLANEKYDLNTTNSLSQYLTIGYTAVKNAYPDIFPQNIEDEPLIQGLPAILKAYDANISTLKDNIEKASKFTPPQIALQWSDGRIHFFNLSTENKPALDFNHTEFPTIYAEFFGDPNKTLQEEIIAFLKDYRGNKGDVAEFRQNPFYFFSLINRHYKAEATTLINQIEPLTGNYAILEMEQKLLDMRDTIKDPLKSHFVRRIEYALDKIKEELQQGVRLKVESTPPIETLKLKT